MSIATNISILGIIYDRDLVPGEFSFVLANANAITAISAMVRIEAVVVKQEWGKRIVTQLKVKEREEMYMAGIN